MHCKYCNNNYPEEFFHVALTTPTKIYRRRKCKFCYGATKKILRDGYARKVAEYKAAKGCSRCGFNNHRALEFHHVSGDKKFNIADKVKRMGWKKLEQEIDKCEILCSNCHRIEHHNGV